MEKYGYNIVIDMEKRVNEIAAIEKIAEALGVECNSYDYGDFYCYDKAATDTFLNKIKSAKLAERVFVYEGKESEDYKWKLIETIETKLDDTFEFNGNDKIKEALTHAASVLTDEYFVQNGMENDHDEEWYNIQENVREAMLKAATNKLLGYFMIGCF